jgi:X-Pro dipeptidyl-peptidase C-terminal non-catalytic domain
VRAGSPPPAPLLPASSPCPRLTTQWTASAAAGPCETDNHTYEATALTYTTTPLTRDTQLTGPVVANLYPELTSQDATLVGVLSDVAPDGTSTQVTAGFLLASRRAVDAQRSTFAPGGVMVRPFHPFTKASPATRHAERPGALPDRDLSDLGAVQAGSQHPADAQHGQHAVDADAGCCAAARTARTSCCRWRG